MSDGQAERAILLVEDSDDHAELTRRILWGRLAKGTILVRVRDGEKARDYLFRQGPYADSKRPPLALLVVDLQLPLSGGMELLAELRQSTLFRNLPTVVLTTSRAEKAAVRELGYPAGAYLLKPLRVFELARALTQYGSRCLEQCLGPIAERPSAPKQPPGPRVLRW